MRKMKFKLLAILYFSLSIGVYAQVTIGSNEKPIAGALLQLKENENLEANSTRGILMPRVSITKPKSLDNLGTGLDLDLHIGLIVYNTNTIENSKENRVCPGLHVWTGEEWQPIMPYPEFKDLREIIWATYPPKQITDPRDNEKYHTAWFGNMIYKGGHDLTGYSIYSCDPNQEIPTLGNGAYWTTENLRTKKDRNGNPLVNAKSGDYAIGKADGTSGNIRYYAYPSTGITSNSTSYDAYPQMGLLYNTFTLFDGQNTSVVSAAGKNQSFPKNGTVPLIGGGTTPVVVGQLNPSLVPIQSYELEATNTKIQGICPTGWHIPSQREWYQLLHDMRLGGQLYSNYYKDDGLSEAQKKYTAWFMVYPTYLPGAPTTYLDAISDNAPVPRKDVYRSNPADKNGFHVLFAGWADATPQSFRYGTLGWFASASGSVSSVDNPIGRRSFGVGLATNINSDSEVVDYNDHKYAFLSVRCVQN